MIEWIWPWVLVLLPVPLLVRRFWPAARSAQPALRAPFFQEWRQLSESQTGTAHTQGRFASFTLWILWLCLLVSAARPIWIGEAIELPNSGRDLMLAVDISGSMRIEDMQLGLISLLSRVLLLLELLFVFVFYIFLYFCYKSVSS